MPNILWFVFAALFWLQFRSLVRVIYNTFVGSRAMVTEANEHLGFWGGGKMAIILLIGSFFNRYILMRFFVLAFILVAWYIAFLFDLTEFIIIGL